MVTFNRKPFRVRSNLNLNWADGGELAYQTRAKRHLSRSDVSKSQMGVFVVVDRLTLNDPSFQVIILEFSY